MIDENFRNDKITITRDELADIIAVETINIMKNARKAVEEGNETLDADTVYTIQSLLLMFGADIMTTLFDESKIGNLEIAEE